jgi:hypothetical protein
VFTLRWSKLLPGSTATETSLRARKNATRIV